MSSGWCPRLHRFTASTTHSVDDDEAEVSELAGGKPRGCEGLGLGYMKGDRWKPSNGRSRIIIHNDPICSMAGGSSCGVCRLLSLQIQMGSFFLLPRANLTGRSQQGEELALSIFQNGH